MQPWRESRLNFYWRSDRVVNGSLPIKFGSGRKTGAMPGEDENERTHGDPRKDHADEYRGPTFGFQETTKSFMDCLMPGRFHERRAVARAGRARC